MLFWLKHWLAFLCEQIVSFGECLTLPNSLSVKENFMLSSESISFQLLVYNIMFKTISFSVRTKLIICRKKLCIIIWVNFISVVWYGIVLKTISFSVRTKLIICRKTLYYIWVNFNLASGIIFWLKQLAFLCEQIVFFLVVFNIMTKQPSIKWLKLNIACYKLLISLYEYNDYTK